jgi:hypothetical protein
LSSKSLDFEDNQRVIAGGIARFGSTASSPGYRGWRHRVYALQILSVLKPHGSVLHQLSVKATAFIGRPDRPIARSRETSPLALTLASYLLFCCDVESDGHYIHTTYLSLMNQGTVQASRLFHNYLLASLRLLHVQECRFQVYPSTKYRCVDLKRTTLTN